MIISLSSIYNKTFHRIFIGITVTFLVFVLLADEQFYLYGQAQQPNATNQRNATKIIDDKFADLVIVEHDSPKRVVLLFYETESTYGWEAVQLLENQLGFQLETVLSSGMGSQGNPTRFFAIMEKP